jgi:eukaryotic-like serine/threonine-protein kinase
VSGKVCPQCGTRYEGEQRFCSLDGATLVAEQRGDSLTGSVLADRYIVKEKLGEGGMGEVYLAEHVRMKRKVAVKVMRKWLTSDPAAIGRFHREAENASQISHPNVAAVYDFGETSDGLVFLAMEFVAGEALTKILERERVINHIRASDIVSQTADALAAAHSLGILHRDLKPDNIMIGKTRVGSDQVKLLDFGIARVMGRDTQHFTSTGLIVGTPDWMSPEQISGDALDARADIYALGLIAFRMLTGEGAYGNGTSQDTLLAKMTKSARRLQDARPDIAWPDALQQTLDRVLAADPGERYSDALGFANDFYYAITQLPMSPEAESYLQALSQRTATPSRGMGSVEMTPARAVAGLTESSPTGVSSISSSAPGFDQEKTEELPKSPTPRTVRAAEEITAAIPLEALADAASVGSATAVLTSDSGEGTAAFGGAAAPPAPRKPRTPLLIGAGVAGVAAIALAVVLMKGGNGAAATPAATTTTAGTPNADTTTKRDSLVVTAPGTDSAAASQPVATVPLATVPAAGTNLTIDAVRRMSEPSVYRVVGSNGSGTGFLADSQGVVITSAAFVKEGDTASVFVDGAKRLWARVLAVDPRRGLAALRISMKACGRGCTALLLASTDVEAKPGDTVIAIGPPSLVRSRPTAAGTVTSVEVAAGKLTAQLRVSSAGAGGPVLLPNRLVVGIAKPAARTGNVVTLATARDFLDKAMVALVKTPAIDSVPPSWPPTPVSEAVLAEGKARKREAVESQFQTVRDAFAVLVMTPQTIAWRKYYGDSLKNNFSAANLSSVQCFRTGICDPIEAWDAWADYVAERRNVVIVEVAPKEAAPPHFGPSTVTFQRGDVAALELRRNNALVPVLQSARYFSVTNVKDYTAKPPFHSVVYVFRASDLAGATKLDIKVYYDDANQRREAIIPFPQKLLSAITADLAAIDQRR